MRRLTWLPRVEMRCVFCWCLSIVLNNGASPMERPQHATCGGFRRPDMIYSCGRCQKRYIVGIDHLTISYLIYEYLEV